MGNYVHSRGEVVCKWHCTTKCTIRSRSTSETCTQTRHRLTATAGHSNRIAGNSTSELAYLKANKGSVEEEAEGRKLNETELAKVLRDWTKEEAEEVWAAYHGQVRGAGGRVAFLVRE